MDGREARTDAVDQAIEYMESLKTCKIPLWELYYKEITSLKNTGNLFDALNKYNEWMDGLLFEYVYHIFVYDKELILKGCSEYNVSIPSIDTSISTTPTSMKLSFPYLELVSSNEVSKKVLCSCCNTELNLNETPCWKCGFET